VRILLFILLGLILSGYTIYPGPSIPLRIEKKKEVRFQASAPPPLSPPSSTHKPEKKVEAAEDRSIRHRFPDSETISMTESQPDPNGVFSRVKVIRTSAAYRMVRIEEKIKKNFSTGEERLMKYVAMMAQELMVQLQPGYSSHDLALLTQKYGYKILRTIPFSNVYLISFDGTDPEALPQVQAKLTDSRIVEIAGPDYISFVNVTRH